MTKWWFGFFVVLLSVGGPRLASAQVTMSPTTIATADTVVTTPTATTSPNASGDLTNSGMDRVDLVIGTCTGTGVGTFTLTPDTNINGSRAIAVNYTPTARGMISCPVNAYANGTTMPSLGSFTITGRGVAPAATLAPTTHDFGPIRELDTAVMTPTSSHVFTVTNNGDTGHDLLVTGIAFSGANPADFSVASGPSFSQPITAGQDAEWTIAFNPAATGARSATMTVTTNDPVNPTRTATLTGQGTTAVIAVSNVTFGLVTSGGAGLGMSSTLSNTAMTDQGVLTAQSATIVPTTLGNTWFTFGTGLGCTQGTTACTLSGATAPANKSIPVRCTPPAGATGAETATLTVTSDSDSGGDNTALLMCTAGRPNIVVDTTPLDFMGQLVNTAAMPKTVTVANDGNSDLTFHFARTGTDAAMFSASTATGCGANALNQCTVAPNDNMVITVGFTPTTSGAKTASLVITNSDPDTGDSPKTIALSGSGIAPIATADPTAIPFSFVEVGKTSSAVTLTVTNTGTANLTITNAGIIAGTDAGQFGAAAGTGTLGIQSTMVAPLASVTWLLTCKPTSQGAKAATFRVVSNSGGSATPVNLDVGLSCTGQRGVLALNQTTFDFMGVREGDAVPQSFTLTNTGNVAVNNIDFVKDAKLLGFTITAPATIPFNLAAGASTTVTVQFAPANAMDGCVVAAAGDCAFTFSGGWGVTPTTTMIALVVQGDGLNATYDTTPATPNALDFGDVRWDQTRTLPISVINTGGSDLAIRGAMITPGTAFAGEFSVVSCTRNNIVVPCPSMAAPYNSSGVNDTLVLNVRCDPANRVAMLDAVLTVSSDLGTNPNRTVPLECNSTTAGLALTPSSMVLDFGPTDLDAAQVAVTRSITMMNTGTAPLNVGAATRAGAHLTRFAFTATTATVVAPGDTFGVDVTYTPLTEKPPNAPDVAEIMFPLTGALAGPNSVTIQISGYGADRHIGVGAAPTYPDTFKNPGDGAPVMPVTISNTGYAPLDVTAVMLDNEPIWTIDNPDPVIIPAASSHDFLVRFQPLMAGKAPTGHMQIMNNDNEVGKALVSVDLNGNGLDRNVAFGPRVIPLGFTGIGIPIRLSELPGAEPLIVENGDMTNGFNIASISVDTIVGAAGTFQVVDRNGDEPVDVPLEPGGVQLFDITFTPDEVGDFEATATLYLDQDPSPAGQVTLRGRGLYVDARGGGGCSAGRGGSSGLLALTIAALVLGRRRRAQAAGALVLVAGIAGTTRIAAAQNSTRNLNINVFEPTPATVDSTFHVQPAGIGQNGDWAATALVTYANNPLVLDTSQNDDAAVKNRTMLLLGGAFVFGGKFEASVRLPLVMQSGDPAGDPTMRFGIEPASGAALCDATVQVKTRLGLVDAAGGTLGHGPSVAFTVPTGTGDEFTGNDLPTVRVMWLATLARGRITGTINAGGVLRETVQFANLSHGSGAVWGAAASFRVLDKLTAAGELFGELIPGGKTTMAGDKVALNTIEGLAGLRYKPGRTMDVGVAVGRGVTSGPGTPAIRGLVTFTYAPSAPERKPIRPARAPGPPKDTDNDGIKDSLDECVAHVEDEDGFRDADGCPDPDNDKDGYLDASDKCPGKAEDRDRFQDDDGCPDLDNDGDGIVDTKDKCRLASEDKDGFQDEDGCPEADNDRDGIVDSIDKCPKEAEVINGTTDNDGCPDKGNSLVVVSPDRLELLESIQFSGTRIAKSSHNLLGQLAATLRAHPEILRVRLTAHVQPTRSAANDEKRSEARANAVRQWLVDWGIDQLRLQSSGFGGKSPLVPASSRGAQQINDRIELIILERK